MVWGSTDEVSSALQDVRIRKDAGIHCSQRGKHRTVRCALAKFRRYIAAPSESLALLARPDLLLADQHLMLSFIHGDKSL